MHEWLRDYAHNPDDIGFAVEFFHSKKLYEQSIEQFQKILGSYGLKIPSDPWYTNFPLGKYGTKEKLPILTHVEIVQAGDGIAIRGEFPARLGLYKSLSKEFLGSASTFSLGVHKQVDFSKNIPPLEEDESVYKYASSGSIKTSYITADLLKKGEKKPQRRKFEIDIQASPDSKHCFSLNLSTYEIALEVGNLYMRKNILENISQYCLEEP